MENFHLQEYTRFKATPSSIETETVNTAFRNSGETNTKGTETLNELCREDLELPQTRCE